MSTYGDYVGANGANGESYAEVAARAVRNVSQQTPSPVYGYFRVPVDGISHQKIYLFNTLEEAQGWIMGLIQSPAQLYDYAAVFVATDLSRPVTGMESFGHTLMGGTPQVGNMLPFLLGLPLGALGGYFYRGWRDTHPGQWIPGIGGKPKVGGPWVDLQSAEMPGPAPYVGGPWLDIENGGAGGPYVGGPWLDIENMNGAPYVGGPWLDIEDMDGAVSGMSPYGMSGMPYVGGPWVDLMGAEMDDRAQRRIGRALIESAKREVIDAQAMTPAAAWVWSFETPSGPLSGIAMDLSSSQITPFASVAQAQAYMFERNQMSPRPVAIALFDTAATGHWPNPVRWSQSDDPAYASLIAQRAAQWSPTRTAGAYVGAEKSGVDVALSEVRDRAQELANKRQGNVIGVIHTTKDNLWHVLAFQDQDNADDWLNSMTQDQTTYTYAAYFDRNDATWPQPVTDKIGGFRAPVRPRPQIGAAADELRPRIGATLAETRGYAKALATSQSGNAGNAAGVVLAVDGTWSSYAFPSLDAAIDWLSSLTAHRGSFSYAGAFEKDVAGNAYVQQEEFGTRPVAPGQHALPAMSGGWGRAA